MSYMKESYDDWLGMEESDLKEEFLESYTKNELISLVVEAEGDIFEYLEEDYAEYCHEQFDQHLMQMAEDNAIRSQFK